MKVFENNNYGRIFAVGDIHGCSKALLCLLKEIEPGQGDLVVTLGDYIDRGPESFKVIEILMRLYEQNILIPLRGNHEMMLLEMCKRGYLSYLKSVDDKINPNLMRGVSEALLEMRISSIDKAQLTAMWRENGGQETINSYRLASADGKSQIPERHYRFLIEGCRDWFETEKYIFVHGGLQADVPLNYQDKQLLYWKRTNSQTEPRHCSKKIVVCGHNVQKNSVPSFGPNAICLETGVVAGGWLSALDFVSGECWQANQLGQVRKFGSIIR